MFIEIHHDDATTLKGSNKFVYFKNHVIGNCLLFDPFGGAL